jgi:DNA-binding NarL/FixJ family response regulator
MNNPISALIADDEDLIRSRLKMTLSPWFKVGEADAIAEARRKWKCDFDLALLDIKFPDGNGIELCREIKAEDPHFTVIMSSSMEEVEAWDESFKAGADGYFEKRELMSLDPRKIRLTIMSLVERNLLRRQAEETAQRQKDLLSVLSHDVRAPFKPCFGAWK